MSGLKRKADSNPQVYGSASSASDDPDLSAASKTTRSQRKPQLRKTVRDRTHSLKQRVENTSKSTISVDDSITMNSSKRKSKKSRISIITLDDSDDDCCFIIQSKATHIEANTKGKENKVVRNNKNNTQNHMIFDSNKLACSANNEIIIIEDDMIQINSLDEMKKYCKETEIYLENANALLEKCSGPSKTRLSPDMTKKTPINDQQRGLGECPVCLENLCDLRIMSTKCGHLFCKDCIEKVATKVKKCPACGKPVNKKNIISIYI